MARKLTADDICAAIQEIEETTRNEAIGAVRGELINWANGEWVANGETQEELDLRLPGLTAVIDFLTENYALD